MSDESPADKLRTCLAPIANSNPMAAFWLLRLELAEDPDAVALELVGQFRETMKGVFALLAPIAELLVPIAEEWLELFATGGAVEAEFHANRRTQ